MTDSLKKAVKIIVEVAKPDRIILFGSHAVGRNKETSDYDLLVLKRNLKDQRRLVQNIYINFKNIGAPIDVLAVDLDRFEELTEDPYLIYADAYKNGKVIYERSPKSKRVAKEGKE